MENFAYYENKFVGIVVGIYGGMRAGVVYGPAVNMPQEPTEHFVAIPNGVDGRDGTMFDPEFWVPVRTSLDVPAR